LLIGSALQAGQFGKIKGTITDIETGEPLPDASVVVVGTVPVRGASTDLDGEYMILQVLPGEYDLECRMMGYKTVTMQGVLVNIDHTTAGIDFQLPSTESRLEDVVVQAKTEKIQIDKVSTTMVVTAQDLERTAVVDVNQVIVSKPGFKTDEEGAIHARGARADQAAILINGIDSRDPLVGGATYLNIDVANIKQLDILSGGFGPEYGQAQAAVIKIETVEGPRDRYTGKLEYRTDQPFGSYSFDTDGTSFAFGGPVPFTYRKNTGPITFYLTARARLTNTYLPFDVAREANDYTGMGLKLPERQVNEYQSTINLSVPITQKTKAKLYFERFFRRWDVYPESAAPLSGNYGYVYSYNEANRPWCENNRINMSLELLHQVSQNATFSTIFSRSDNKTLVSPRGKSPGDFTLEFNITEQNYEDAKSDFLGLVDVDGNGFYDGFVDANNNGIYDGVAFGGGGDPIYSEGYEDLNRNGRWDRGEDWIDLNGNGIYDSAEPFDDVTDPSTGLNNLGVYDPWDPFVDTNGNGIWDDAEPQLPEQDTNHNGRWDGERFQDANGNGIWDGWTEPFVDANGNGIWDEGEPYWDLPSSGPFGTVPFLNGKHDSTNYIFDEYELFTRWASFVSDPYFSTHDYTDIRAHQTSTNWNEMEDVSMPVIYTYDPEMHGADWPTDITAYDPVHSTWLNRTLHDEAAPVFNEPNFAHDAGEEYFIDYNQNGRCDEGAFSERTYGMAYNPQGYYDFFLNPGAYDGQAFWQNRRSITYNLKSEYQSQVNKYHEVLLGAQLTHRKMTMSSIDGPNKPYTGYVVLPEGSPWPDRGQVRDFYDHNPTEGALYFKDKMEFEGLFVLIGARWDFLLHEESTISEMENAYTEGQPGAILPERGVSRVAPRLGISHPITETAKLYFNYGHFYQTPSFQYFYRALTGNKANDQVVGNPNLRHEKTVEYQFGVEAEFNENTLINLQGFYRDIFDQISTVQVEVSRGYFIDRYMNIDYGRARGFSVSYNRNTAHTVWDANYELSFAYGKASSAEAALLNRVENEPVNRDEHPLNWDQTHSINAYWSLFYGPGDHPQLFGMKLPADWLASISFTFGSGRPYTPSKYTLGIDNAALILSNSSRMPWTETTNVKLEKYFRFGGDKSNAKLVVGLDVRNLFNKRNVRSLYTETGTTYQSMHSKNPDHIFYYPNKNTFDANPWNYSAPRNIMLRVAYSF